MFTVDMNFVRLDVSSTWHLYDLNCGSRCNSTLAPLATCARVLWENTGFCVGVRGPHSRELRYIRGLWQVACASWAFSGVKSMNMVGLLVEQLHRTAMELEVNLISITKTSNKNKLCWTLDFLHTFSLNAQIRVSLEVHSCSGRLGVGCCVMCVCVAVCIRVVR